MIIGLFYKIKLRIKQNQQSIIEIQIILVNQVIKELYFLFYYYKQVTSQEYKVLQFPK
ncbi:unnamed protein product [Paramecium octaurelia]|uniref:Uncharacterized protein n=1 Tax=Paramecium octaurelia TaxID=43137 RepID=A0A8S1W7L6_PAROT|nr:unnamed protein product [Paramecium octaurelia]